LKIIYNKNKKEQTRKFYLWYLSEVAGFLILTPDLNYSPFACLYKKHQSVPGYYLLIYM